MTLFCSFVCLFIATRAIFSYLAAVTIAGDRTANLAYARRSGSLSREVYFYASSSTTQDLRLYSLIQKTGTNVPQWYLNCPRKNHQIIAPDVLTIAQRRRFNNDVVNTTS
jgi:hypothetical protein